MFDVTSNEVTWKEVMRDPAHKTGEAVAGREQDARG